MARAGRKRQPGIREPNGRLSRSKPARIERERDIKAVMISARMRQTGLPESLVDGRPELGKPNVGTTQGWLRIQGELNKDQFQAADWYLGKRNEYLQAIAAPGAVSNRVISPEEGGNPEAYGRWCRRTMLKWDDIMSCLQVASTIARMPIISAFDHILDRQTPSLPHMYGGLRIGLTAIYRIFLRVGVD